jgi:predicted cation transporter
MEAALWCVVLLVLVLPLAVRAVEENIELFLLAAGALAVSLGAGWSAGLLLEAARGPVPITLTVLAVGLAFHYGRRRLDSWFRRLLHALPRRLVLFALVAGLGLVSSAITAIIAALLLVEAVNLLHLSRRQETAVTVLACFSIGMGAVLTPLGEPLSAIATAKLHADFWHLGRLMWPWIVPGILALGLAAAFTPVHHGGPTLEDRDRREPLPSVFLRAGRVYVFVAALVLLGAGLAPLADRYVPRLPAWALYWANCISAVLDNATLAAAEITPAMSQSQLLAVLLGLVLSGGMLVPGNIPNIVSAGHLRIKSREWARAAFLPGLILLAGYFLAWLLFGQNR